MATTTRSLHAYRQAETVRGASERDQMIVRHLPLVHSVVERIAAHLPATVDKEDLFHAGVIGLIDALSRFDPSRDNAFSTYAVLRIRGQIIDELRDRDWIPRGVRNRAREYQQAVAELSQRLGRTPNDHELSSHLHVDEGELLAIENEAQLSVQISLDAPVGEDSRLGAMLPARGEDSESPGSRLERDDQRQALMRVLETLTEQERQVVKMYYFENLLMKEIADVLGLTESRICQIHSRVITLLRARLGRHDGFW